MQILIIEDDRNISKLVKYNLEKEGFSCLTTITGEEGLKILEGSKVDLVVLDVMLPKMDGFEVCKKIRSEKKFNHIPIVMLTARGEEVDRVVGFELGADDYIVKPFSLRELLMRVKAILKRGKAKDIFDKEILATEHIRIDIPRHRVFADEKEIDLSPMEFKLLATLIQRRGRVQSREKLLEDVWGISTDVTTRTVDTHIKLLRQKLGAAGEVIQTVRGMGYKLSDEE